MSDEIDNKVVSMKFDNKQFEQNIAQTMASLQKLQSSLGTVGTGKGLSDLQRQADKFNLDTMDREVSALSAKFVALSTVAITTLANITNRAVDAGFRIAKSLTLDPVLAGFQEYELKMGSIQTILANTSKDGTTLEDVTKSLDELNEYSDKTIYNFGAMTKNIGLFTNAGLGLEESVAMIKGFSNEAAASGTNAEGAAAAAYQLSQALSAGTIRLMDWRSLQNVGMGNKNMQNGLIDLADAMGKFNKDTLKAEEAQKNFNGSLEKNWLSADVMANYLKIQAGELNDEQMRSLGLTNEQISAFKKQAKIAEESATKVRTFTQLMGTIKESIASGWSETFNLLIGDFDQATNLWTKVNDTLGGMIKGFGDKRNQVLKDWADLGGRTVLIEALGNAFSALNRILRPIGDAFREVFSPTTWSPLYKMTVAFRDFTEKLKIGAPQMFLLKQIFQTFFSVIKIGLKILGGLASLVTNVFSLFGDAASSTDGLSLSLGEMLKKFNKWLSSTDGIEDFFEKLRNAQTKILTPIVKALGKIADAGRQVIEVLATGNFSGGFLQEDSPIITAAINLRNALKDLVSWVKQVVVALTTGDFQGGFLQEDSPIITAVFALRDGIGQLVDKVKEAFGIFSDTKAFDTSAVSLENLGDKGDAVVTVWDKVVQVFTNLKEGISPALSAIGAGLKEIWDKFADWFKEADFQDLVALINTGFFIAFYLQLRKFLKSLESLTDSWGRIADAFADFGTELTDTLKAMQTSIKAGAILKIAIAIGILAAAIIALGLLDGDALKQGTAAVAGALVAITGVFMALGKADLTGGKTIAAIAAAVLIMSVAIRVLVSSVKSLGKMDEDALEQGLVGLAALVGGVIALITALSLAGPQVAVVGGTILAISAALIVMGGVVAILGQMGLDTLLKGVIAVGYLTALISALVAVLGAVGATGPAILAGGASVVLISGAMLLFVGVVERLGNMKLSSLIAAIIALNAITIIVGMLVAMATVGEIAALAGGAGLLMTAIGVKILADAVEQLGKLPIKALLIGMGALLVLTGLIAVIGAVSLVASPGLLLLGTALLMIGSAMFLAGVGMTMLAAGITTLATLGSAGLLVLTTAFETLINLLPLFAQQLGYAVIAFAQVMGEAAPVLIEALGKLLSALYAEIVKRGPEFGAALVTMIQVGLRIIRKITPELIATGWYVLTEFLNGIKKNIREISTTIAEIIVAFIDGISDNINSIIQAGTNLIQEFLWGIMRASLEIINTAFLVLITFLNGIEQAIRDNDTKIREAGLGIADAILDGIIEGLGLTEPLNRLRNKAIEIANSLPGWMRTALGIKSPSRVMAEIGRYVVEGFAVGLKDARGKTQLKDAFKAMNNELKNGLKDVNAEIKAAQEEKARLLESGNASYKEIADVNSKIQALQAEKARIAATQKAYVNNMDDEREKLLQLSKAYDAVTWKLEKAQDKLNDLKSAKQSKRQELFDQYYQLPDIDKTTGLQGYMNEAKNSLEATKKYKASLDRLRKQGLDDRAYEKLLEEGPEAQSLVNQLEQGGKGAISEFNKVNNQLASQANQLAKDASSKLYDAGIRAAEGLVAGLKKEQSNLDKQMRGIADSMVRQIKKGLGIKSPSREFAKVAIFAVDGLVKGFKQNKKDAGKAAAEVGDETLNKMRDSIRKIRDTAETQIDAQPVIAPVVDLTDFKKGIKDINKTKTPTLDVKATAKAAKLAAGSTFKQGDLEDPNKVGAIKQVIFNQTNNSPESLSSVDIYRQTKTLVSQVKGA